MLVVNTMVKLFAAIILGYWLGKKGLFDHETSTKMSSLIVNYTCLCLMLNSVGSVPRDNPALIIKLFFVGLFCYAVLYTVIGFVYTRIIRVPKGYRGTYTTFFIFANTSFMAYPVVQAFIGTEAIFYLAIFNLPFMLIYYTVALNWYRADAEITDGTAGEKRKIKVRDIFNNGMIASIIVLIIFFGNIPLPSTFYACMEFIGGITTPLSMLLMGASISGVALKELVSSKRIIAVVPGRLILMPVVVYFIMRFTIKDPVVVASITLCAGMPIASMVGMGCMQYSKQNKEASIATVLTTIVSMITLPVIAILLGCV